MYIFKTLKIINKKSFFYFLVFLTSLIWVNEITYLFYDTTISPDYAEYKIYFDYFLNPSLNTGREHGLSYYYIHYINYYLKYNSFDYSEVLLHKSIHEVNFYIYCFGLIGFFLVFKFLKFKSDLIFISFTFLNFFPISIVQRIVFKPEILAYALLPWIVFFLEKYKKERKTIHLLLSIPFLVICITLKGNILVLISVFIFLAFINEIIRLDKKILFLLISIFIISFSLVTIENNKVNNKGILEVQSGATLRENYNNKAPINTIYNINLFKLLTSPIKYNHSGSFIGITLLETTGDYFDLYWDNDASIFFENRISFLKFEISNEITSPNIKVNPFFITIFTQKETDLYIYEFLGLIMSLFFFFFLLKNIFKEQKFRLYKISVFIGMGLILFHTITGLPVNNFDPARGDTFKPQYYSFLFIFSTLFFIYSSLENNKKAKFFIFIYIVSIIFILGFPKYKTPELMNSLSPFIEHSDFCEFEILYFGEKSLPEVAGCFDHKRQTDINKYFSKNFVFQPANLYSLIIILLISISVIIKEFTFNIKKFKII